MSKDIENDDFLVQHLVDPNDWVADHERTVCNVCTRAFGTFRRKHHCRMCGEVVCSGCTLHKNALLTTIGHTRVRVCISCIFNGGGNASPPTQVPPMSTRSTHATHSAISVATARRANYTMKTHSPRSTSPTTQASDESSRRWLSNHLHSPVSQADPHDYENPVTDSPSGHHRYNFGDNQRTHHSGNRARSGGSRRHYSNARSNQDTHDRDQDPEDDAPTMTSPLHPLYPNWTHPWPKPPVPYDEVDRLEALAALQIMDTAAEKAFDMICDLAKARLACPMAAVSFMDEHRQWFKASVGLAHKTIPRKIAFCAYTVFAKEPVVVLDTLKDKRFDCNPLVSGAAAVRFYAAAPILDPHTGYAVGSVFVLDTRPRESCDLEILERLAQAASENLPQRADDSDDERPSVHHQFTQIAPMPVVSHAETAPASPAKLSSALATSEPTANGESMEALLMRLLTQNTETQQQLASQQVTLHSQLNQHSAQISRLMSDVARMEAKIDTGVRNRM
jgi:hypothetical protein